MSTAAHLELAEALLTPQGLSQYLQQYNLPSGSALPAFDPTGPDPRFSFANMMKRFGAIGGLAGQVMDRVGQHFMPSLAHYSAPQPGEGWGQHGARIARYNAFQSMVAENTAITARSMTQGIQGTGLVDTLRNQAGQFLANSRFAGAFTYGGALSQQGLGALYSAAGNLNNRFVPGASEATAYLSGFRQYYETDVAGSRSQRAVDAAARLTNDELAGVWAVQSSLQRRGADFITRGRQSVNALVAEMTSKGKLRVLKGDEDYTAEEESALQREASTRFGVSRFDSSDSAYAQIGAGVSGVEQLTRAYKDLTDIGGSTQGLGSGLEMLAESFDISKLDTAKIRSLSKDIAEVAAATGSSIDELSGFFTAVGKQMRGSGIKEKAAAIRAYAGSIALSGIGIDSLSASQQKDLFNVTTEAAADFLDSTGVMTAKLYTLGGKGPLTREGLQRFNELSYETLEREYGPDAANIMALRRQGRIQEAQDAVALLERGLESGIAEYNMSTDKDQRAEIKRRLESRYGQMVETDKDGQLRKSSRAQELAIQFERRMLENQYGPLVSAEALKRVNTALGKDVTDEQALSLLGSMFNEEGRALDPEAARAAVVAVMPEARDWSAAKITEVQQSLAGLTGGRSEAATKNVRAWARARATQDRLNNPEVDKALRDSGQLRAAGAFRGAQDETVKAYKDLLTLDMSKMDAETIKKTIAATLDNIGMRDTTSVDAIQAELMALKKGGDPERLTRFQAAFDEFTKVSAEITQLPLDAAPDKLAKLETAKTNSLKVLQELSPQVTAAMLARNESTNGQNTVNRGDVGGPMEISGVLRIEGNVGYMQASSTQTATSR